MQSTRGSAPRQIRSHAALRGVAALLVVAYHLQLGAAFRLPAETATHILSRGYLAVDLFFVLSGFIIAYVNRADRSTPFSSRDTRTFLQARFARLYPLLGFSLAALAAFRALVSLIYLARGSHPPMDWSPWSWWVLATQVLLLNAWLPGLQQWNIPSWSISAEVAAYALFPLIVTAHARAPRRCEAAMMTAASLFYLIVAARSGSLDIVGGPGAPLRCIAGFMLGMLLHAHRDRIARYGDAALSFAQAAAVVAILVLLAIPACDPLIVPAFVLLVGASWSDRGIVARLLGWAPLTWLGELSYSIYLNHVGVIEAAYFVWPWLVRPFSLTPATERMLWIALVYVAVIGVSTLTFRFVERPGRQWLARRLTGRAAPPITASPPGP